MFDLLDNKRMNVESAEVSIFNPDGSRKTAIVYHFVVDDFNVLKQLIDQYVLDLVYGDNSRSFDAARNALKRFIQTKSSKQKLGIVSELLMHLSLNHFGAVRYSLIKNLEENSMKKGFDGVYLYMDEIWFGESKSSSVEYEKHISNIDEAVKDFGKKVKGKAKNNPWENALNHINLIKNRTFCDQNLIQRITQLSDNFEKDVYSNSDDYNIFPSSTLIFDQNQDFDDICNDCKKHLASYAYRKLIIICIDNYLYKNILDYLENVNE